MDIQNLFGKYSPFIKQNILSIALGLLGLIFFSYGLIVLIGRDQSSSNEIVFEAGKEQGSENPGQITIDIEGQVLRPGVYNLSSDSRLQDAFVIAGGLSDSADREWVYKNLNLSQKLTDAAKIYVPKKGENVQASKRIGENQSKSQININTASINELDGLSGVGLVTAQKIIDNRPYATINDLVSKKVVGNKVFEQIKEKIIVY
ncbi:MAG: ComEA family DNA-binding protein [Patescibacteria group bacterium]